MANLPQVFRACLGLSAAPPILSVVGNCSPARHAGFRHLANQKVKKGVARPGEVSHDFG
ncbi:uncharacterized protein LACBIDRAFT_308373 [Laccaria bicolor S238N-H82]|uniref:Predicted protein n=1 Tax=Laccaria bicolor (strain S238N-H82 / ATCC MYA-4686) TaxID=486041 RepID=B0CW48_LACBS|nr:uncharacterized protein LACBIDRAFT_308373 [Laccaria bicolor S238N-H82]EDR13448.1 predicted protein [Laccaria bicolor S238N-H82]|eukprot:XP_001875946.1 predicted protein [Laccaria bicolor S238N-H82]